MANELDETTGPVNEKGQDVHVINKKITPKHSTGAVVLEIVLWILAIIPGVIYEILKAKSKSYLKQLEQSIQHDASQIDNYLEQRVQILKNQATLMGKAIKLDEDIMGRFANARGANALNEKNEALTQLQKAVNVAFENYPKLQSHEAIQKSMQQNDYLQREITAARDVYNDRVLQWNSAIYAWPIKINIAAKEGYTTRIPFTADSTTKEAARGEFFK